jgi:hypothetical protein
MNNFLRGIVKRQLVKNIQVFMVFQSLIFLATKSPCKEGDGEQQKFVEDLCLLVVKKYLPIQFVENVWLKRLCMHLCPQL